MGARVSAAIPTFIHSLIELCVFSQKKNPFVVSQVPLWQTVSLQSLWPDKLQNTQQF